MYTLLCYFHQLSASILLIVARLLEKVISIVPWGDTLIFSHIRRLGAFFGVQNSKFQYFWGFSEKLIFLGGMKILWIFLGIITKLG